MSLFRRPQDILFSNDVSRVAAFYSRLGFSETFRVPEEGEPIHVDRPTPTACSGGRAELHARVRVAAVSRDLITGFWASA